MDNLKEKFLTYNGRITRSQYWLGLFFIMIVSFAFGLVFSILGFGGNDGALGVDVIFTLIMVYPAFCLYIKRFHDMDKSGWFSLLLIVPVVNMFVGLFWLGFVKGTDGANKYGEDPLSVSDAQ